MFGPTDKVCILYPRENFPRPLCRQGHMTGSNDSSLEIVLYIGPKSFFYNAVPCVIDTVKSKAREPSSSINNHKLTRVHARIESPASVTLDSRPSNVKLYRAPLRSDSWSCKPKPELYRYKVPVHKNWATKPLDYHKATKNQTEIAKNPALGWRCSSHLRTRVG